MPGAIDDVNAPKSMQNIVLEVMKYVQDHWSANCADYPPKDFNTYDRALHAVWPGLFKSDAKAALLVSVSIYIDIAERWDFTQAVPEEIKGLRL